MRATSLQSFGMPGSGRLISRGLTVLTKMNFPPSLVVAQLIHHTLWQRLTLSMKQSTFITTQEKLQTEKGRERDQVPVSR